MNATEIRTALDTQYDLSHALHLELARVRDAHGTGFLDDPHYLMLATAIDAVSASINTLSLLRLAVPAEQQTAPVRPGRVVERTTV